MRRRPAVLQPRAALVDPADQQGREQQREQRSRSAWESNPASVIIVSRSISSTISVRKL